MFGSCSNPAAVHPAVGCFSASQGALTCHGGFICLDMIGRAKLRWISISQAGRAGVVPLHPILVYLFARACILRWHMTYWYILCMIYLDVSVVSCMSPKSIAVARIVGIMKKLRRWLLESENEAEMSSSQVGQSRAHTHARTHVEFMVATRAITLAFFGAKLCISCTVDSMSMHVTH